MMDMEIIFFCLVQGLKHFGGELSEMLFYVAFLKQCFGY